MSVINSVNDVYIARLSRLKYCNYAHLCSLNDGFNSKIDGFQSTCFWRPILLLTVLLLLSLRGRPEQLPSFRKTTASSSGDPEFKYGLSRLKIYIGFFCIYRKLLL